MSVKTLTQLAAQAQTIKNETARGANTADRVGTFGVDAVDTIFGIRKPELYFAKNKLIADLGNNATEYADVYLQVVHYNKRRKCWQAASGAGVKLISTPNNGSQVGITNVNLLRCKVLLANNVSEFDFDNAATNIYMFANLFDPYYKLRQYSFKDMGIGDGPSFDLINIQRNTNYIRTSFHKYGLKKTGLAITKTVTNASGSKSQILSDILPFKIRVNNAKTIATVNFGSKRKFNAGLS